jgi:Concanavalin A-like lectin/glucanases superfamily
MPLFTRWKSKPWPGVGINWSHPLAQNLVMAVAFNEGSGLPIEIISGAQPTVDVTPYAWDISPYGPSAKYTAGQSSVKYSAVPACGPAMSAFCLAKLSSMTVSDNFMLVERELVNASWALFYSIGAFTWRGGSGTNRVSLASTSTPITANTWFAYGVTETGVASTGAKLWVNGVVIASGTAGAVPVRASTPIHLGTYDGSGYPLAGGMAVAYVWDRCLSDIEMQSISANPWRLFNLPAGWLFKSAAAPPFLPWYQGDQIGEMYG